MVSLEQGNSKYIHSLEFKYVECNNPDKKLKEKAGDYEKSIEKFCSLNPKDGSCGSIMSR